MIDVAFSPDGKRIVTLCDTIEVGGELEYMYVPPHMTSAIVMSVPRDISKCKYFFLAVVEYDRTTLEDHSSEGFIWKVHSFFSGF